VGPARLGQTWAVNYDDVIAAFFTAPPDPALVPAPARSTAPARRLRDAIEPLAMHSVWSRRTNEALAAHGLDFLASYVGGRAAALGEPLPSVVVATFGVFEPGMLTATYDAARQACDRRTLLAERERATIESLHDVLDDIDVTGVVAALRRGVDAGSVLGRPLFAGLSDLSWPDDPVGQLWRCCELLREHRGDGHIGVLVAEGLDPVEANVVTELWVGMALGSYSGTRGWGPDALAAACRRLESRGLVLDGALTIEGLDVRIRLEQATDRGEQAVIDAIGDEFEAVVGQLVEWSAACVAAGAFPPDPFKRAAG
jgi:hypothetical protein